MKWYYFPIITLGLGLFRLYFKGLKANRKNMNGKTVIITGASAGIGKETYICFIRRRSRSNIRM